MVGLLRLSRMEPRYRCDRDAGKAGRFSVVAIFSELDDTTLCNDKVRKYTISVQHTCEVRCTWRPLRFLLNLWPYYDLYPAPR
jgi:hypothetical protein